MINQLKEIQKCYPCVNMKVLEISNGALREMQINDPELTKIMQILAFACYKHYQYGYNSKK